MLQSSHIVLSEMTNSDGTKRTGSIQSSNYEEGVSGFRIRWDGDVEFNNGKFRGHVEANSGKFTGVIEANGGYFKNIAGENMAIRGGTIDIGPLHVSAQQTGNTSGGIFPVGTNVLILFNEYLPENPAGYGSSHSISRSVPVYFGGKYGSWTLNSMVFTKTNMWEIMHYSLELFTSDGKKDIFFTENLSPGVTNIYPILSYKIEIYGGGAGSTFRLDNMPRSPGQKGTLYVEPGGNTVRISGY